MASSPSIITSTGACMCHKITYYLDKPPLTTCLCHCAHCRRVTGSSFFTSSIYPKDALTITSGENLLKSFIDNSTSSGKALTRQFCGECGSPLFVKTEASPDTISVAAGSLDNVGEWTPSLELYCGNKAVWLPEFEGLERHTTQPSALSPDGLPAT